MKKPLLNILISAALLLSGCAAPEDPVQPFFPENPIAAVQTETESPAQKGAVGLEVPSAAPDYTAPSGAPKPMVTVTDTAAYVFDGMEGPTLYGAAAYQNSGNCPVIITEAEFSFELDSAPHQAEFTPVLNQQCVVLPGEICFITYWHSDPSFTPGVPAALTAALTCEEAASTRIQVDTRNIYMADNYPGFTTMTGSISARDDCSMNLIYTGFYDAAGRFLGAWHFTRNVQLDQGEYKSFTVHMQALPIDGLGERTASVRTYGVGF